MCWVGNVVLGGESGLRVNVVLVFIEVFMHLMRLFVCIRAWRV